MANNSSDIKKLSLAGLIITMGIVFGDLGTSPLYTMRAIVAGGGKHYTQLLIYGGLSCIFWTLTLSTTLKYVIILLKADNKGEGGIFALYALIRRKSSWAAILTMVGGAALLADGVITPSISVTSSIEGLKLYSAHIPIVPIVLFILAVLFFIQQFGTNFVGSSFGPIMLVWFLTIGIIGFTQLTKYPDILMAVNPVFAYRFLTQYPGGFILLGAVFLCTTGAGALYADLGHCGKTNIRVAWIFVKTALLLNYFGQGAWLMRHIETGAYTNPFFEMMPHWFLIPGVVLATAAAIIASQAIISGSFTLIGEAVSLNFWPTIRVLHPTYIRGQVYLPTVNLFLWLASSFVVFIFRESSNLNAAYGLAITITEIMTTFLLSYYLLQKKVRRRIILPLFMTYILIEGSFLVANLHKFTSGGWLTVSLASLYFLIMFGWYFGRKIKNRYITFAFLEKYLDMFRDLSKDETVPKFTSNLVYIIRANKPDQVESKVIYSIFQKQPKRADIYWFIHVNKVNEPNTFNYKVLQIIPGILIRIDFNIGFKVEPKMNLYFREVLEDMQNSGEIEIKSRYESLKKHNIEGDFKFILIDRIMSRDYTLSTWENFVLSLNSLVRKLSMTDIRSLNLDSTNTIIEQVPITIDQPVTNRIRRIQ
ncbi:MAG: KUP/HAK/KT family potassium transporter [Bacteroidales bacterium]|jgi:KUP system potassium uptake protein